MQMLTQFYFNAFTIVELLALNKYNIYYKKVMLYFEN